MKLERIKKTEIMLQSIEKVLRRLVRVLVGRVSFEKLNALLKQIFAEESEQQLRRENPGKQIPLTRLALVTGLDTRVLAKIKNGAEFGRPNNQASPLFFRNNAWSQSTGGPPYLGSIAFQASSKPIFSTKSA